MKTNSTFVTAVVLALLSQFSALPQTDSNSKVPPLQTAKNEAAFFFPGGTPRQFLDALEKQYKADWSKVADIPVEMQLVQIPALRMNRESLEPILSRARFGGFPTVPGASIPGYPVEERNPLRALVALYNSLQQAKPELGQLIVEGDYTNPSIVMFRPPNLTSPPTADFKMKAFPLKGIPEKDWEKLRAEVGQALKDLPGAQDTPTSPHGRSAWAGARVTLHKDSGLLLALGPEPFVNAVDSIVTAWHKNQQHSEPKTPTEK